MHDGSITFSTELDNKQLEKDLAGLTKKIEKQEQKIADLSAKRDRAKEKSIFDVKELDAEKAKLKELKDQLAEVRAVSKDRSYSQGAREEARAQIPGLQEELSEQRERVRMLQTEWNKTENAVDRYTAQLEHAKEVLSRQKEEAGYIQQQILEADQARADALASAEVSDQRIVDLNRELLELKERQKELEEAGLGLGHLEYDETAARIAEVTQELKEYQKALNDTRSAGQPSMEEKLKPVADNALSVLGRFREFKNAADQAIGSIISAMNGLWSTVVRAGSAVKQFSKSAVKAFTQAALSAVKLLDRVNVLPKMFSTIGKSLTKLGQMIRRVFVFSVITSGLRMIREQMSAYLGINAQFSTALQQLKGVLLTAFQPIYDVVVPALTVLMNVLSRAIAAISQFTAVLFGTTAKQAQKNAKALYNQAKATSAAGSAAEEASNQLASFDEINKLQDESSAGGGAETDIGPLFDWEYDDTPFPDWGEAFDAFLDKLLAGIPKLREAFKSFADWLNDLNQKLYDMFTFPGVPEKVKQLGVELANALNDLVNWIDWELWGRALGAGLNLALNFLTSFLYEFDWINLGRKLAEFINGLVDEIDWYEFGRLLWSGFKIGLETLAGFLLGLDMPLLAKAAGNIVMGFFNEMKATIDRIQWSEIGEQIARFLANIDWPGILSSVANAIAAGFNAMIDLLGPIISSLKWEEIGRTVGQAINDVISEIEWTEAGETITNGIRGVLTAAIEFIETVDWHQIGKALASIDWLGILSDVVEVIGEAIWAVIEMIGGIIEDNAPAVLLAIGALVAAIALGIPGIIMGLDPVIIGAIAAMVAVLIAKWDDIVEYFLEKIEECGGNIVAGLLKGIADAIVGIGTWLWEHLVEPIISAVMDLFGIHSPSTVFAEIGEFLIAGLFQGISDTWHTITEFFGEKLEALKQSLLDAWENIKESAAEKWSEIKESLGQKFEEIREAASEKFEELRTKIAEIWENTREEAAQRWEEIKSALAETWENIKTSAQEKFTNVKQAIIDKMNELKDHDWMSIGSTIMNGIWDGLKKIWDSITSWASSVASRLGDIFTGAKNAVSGIASGITGGGASRMATYSMPDISTYQIPALAQGAVIPPNREFMAVLGDQSRGNNLEAPEDLIRKIVREEAGGNNTALLEAILEAIKAGHIIMVDRKVLGQTVTQEQNRMTRAGGRSVLLG